MPACESQAGEPHVDALRNRRCAGQIGYGVVALLGVFVGLGLFTVGYGDGTAYLRDDPVACTNCHVMQAQYDSWLQSSHTSAATCNDCHLRHDFVGKWLSKAESGLSHSVLFTTGNFPDVIRVHPRGRQVVQQACLECHSDFVHSLLPARAGGEVESCVKCHASVGHAGR